MAAGAAIYLITGVPFAGASFGVGTDVITIPGNWVLYIGINDILLVNGTGTTNDGYYKVASTAISGSNTLVTVTAYNSNGITGTLPFVASSSITIIDTSPRGAAPSQAATPTFSPVAGTYSVAQSVSIMDSTAGDSIYYTTDGSSPTTSSTPYTGPVSINSTTTLNALATATGFSNSAIGSATYTLVATPLTWTSRTSPTTNAITGISTSSGTTLIVDVNGGVFKSTNGGHTWAAQGSGITVPTQYFGSLAQGGSTLIYSAGANTVYRSTDGGTTWTGNSTGIGTGAQTSLVTNGSGTWVVSSGVISFDDIAGNVTSGSFTNGETITQAVTGATAYLTGTNPPTDLYVVQVTGTPDTTHVWTGNSSGATFTPTSLPTIVGGVYAMAYSTNDGVSWTPFDPFNGGCFAVGAYPIWNGTEFVAIVNTGVSRFPPNNVLATSTNGISWTTTAPTNSGTLFGLGLYNSKYLAFDPYTTSIVLSPTVAGLATTAETPISASGSLTSEAGGAGKYFVFDIHGGVTNSADGIVWGQGTLNMNQYNIYGEPPQMVAMTGGVSGHLIVVGQNGATFVSTDGATWTYNSSGQTTTLNDVTAAGSVDMAVGQGGVILTSTDDLTWTAHNQGTQPWYGVAYMQARHGSLATSATFVVGVNGIIGSTDNGTTWVANTIPSGAASIALNSGFAQSGNFQYIVGDSGVILQSNTSILSNNITWTQMSVSVVESFYCIYGNNNAASPIIVVVGSNGTIGTSTDNATWTFQNISALAGFDLTFVTYDFTNNLFVTGSDYAPGVYTSPDGVTWTYQPGSDNDSTTFGGYNQSPNRIGSASCLTVGISANFTTQATGMMTIQTTTDDVTWTQRAQTPPFTIGETITQAGSGATATFIGFNANNPSQLMVLDNLTGTPTYSGTWIGNTSNSVIDVFAVPEVDYASTAVYDATNSSFIAVGFNNGSISTYP